MLKIIFLQQELQNQYEGNNKQKQPDPWKFNLYVFGQYLLNIHFFSNQMIQYLLIFFHCKPLQLTQKNFLGTPLTIF